MSVWIGSGCSDCDSLTSGRCWRHATIHIGEAPATPRPMTAVCNHCYCITPESMAVTTLRAGHRRCCKCSDDMSEQFIAHPFFGQIVLDPPSTTGDD